MEPKSGVGHQYKKVERTMESVKKSLDDAYNNLDSLEKNQDIYDIMNKIMILTTRCLQLEYAAREAQKQDN